MNQQSRNALVAIMILTICTSTLITTIVVVSNNRTGGTPIVTPPPQNKLNNITKNYLGSFSESEYLPFLLLYDPYGDKSYQKTASDTSVSFTLQMEGENGIEVNGSIPSGFSGGFSSSMINDSNYVGPGKGDGIAGSIYVLTWDVYQYNETNVETNVSRVYYHLDLVSSSVLGGFAAMRSYLATHGNTTLQDKTGQSAPYTMGYEIGVGLSAGHNYDISWSGTIRTGFSFKIKFSGTIFNITYSIICSTLQTIHVTAHYEDSSHELFFLESSDNATAGLDKVFSNALWYSLRDSTPPTISSPQDQHYLVGTTSGHNITWTAGDQHPWQYKVDELYKGNLNTVAFGEWHNQSITWTLGNLSVGTHTYTCTVRDGEGNTASDSVNVTVTYPHSIRKVYLEYFYEREYIPILVLYDPYGDGSYQKTLIGTKAHFTLSMEGENGVEVNGSFPTGISFSFGSSMSTGPSDMGPGIGDSILAYTYDLGWNVYRYYDTDPNTNTTSVYYHLDLVSCQYAGTLVLSRSDFTTITNSTIVEDKTGQLGNYTWLNLISAGGSVDHYYNYSWFGTVKTGFSFKMHFSGIVFNITYSFICSTPQTIPVQAHFHDGSHVLSFYETADNAVYGLSEVFSYALWYNPA